MQADEGLQHQPAGRRLAGEWARSSVPFKHAAREQRCRISDYVRTLSGGHPVSLVCLTCVRSADPRGAEGHVSLTGGRRDRPGRPKGRGGAEEEGRGGAAARVAGGDESTAGSTRSIHRRVSTGTKAWSGLDGKCFRIGERGCARFVTGVGGPWVQGADPVIGGLERERRQKKALEEVRGTDSLAEYTCRT